MPVQLHIYRDLLDGWRWRLVDAGNFRIVADSGESYTRKADAHRAAEHVCTEMHGDVEIVDTRPD
jgi:uncharacterized protein YegP (UPF0339 family)